MKKVIVMGYGDLAIKICEWFQNSNDYAVQYVVPTIPEPEWADSLVDWTKKRWSRSIGAREQLVSSGNYRDIPGVDSQDWQVDLVFSCFYNKIIKPWFINKCDRILNLHNSALPKYRGVRPINWALKNNETKHGITIHEITPGVDDGPIISQLEYSIYPDFEEVTDVYNRSLEYGWILFKQTMSLLDKISPRPQDHSKSTHYTMKQNHLLGDRENYHR